MAPPPVVAASAPDSAPPPSRPHETSVDATAGEVVHEVVPDVPDYARKTIRGKVRIQVRAAVDAAGHVTDANVESQNSGYFAKLSLQAARQWEFAPAAGDWLLRFEFTAAGTTVHSSRAAHMP